MPPDPDPDHGLEANYLATSLWPEAVKLYEKTNKPLAELPKFNSIDELYVYVERSATKFKEFREDSPSWMNKLRSKIKPVACVVQTLSGALGDAVSMARTLIIPYSPMKAVFTAIGVVVETAMKVKEDFDDILTVFDTIDQYLRIIAPLASRNMHEALRGASVKLLAQILNVFGVIGKTQKEGRMKHFIKKLAHGKEVPDALKELGRLASTHHQMISAVTLDTVRRMMSALGDFIASSSKQDATGFCLGQIKEIVQEIQRLVFQTSSSSMEQMLDDRKVLEHIRNDLYWTLNAFKSGKRTDDLAKIYKWLSYPDSSVRMNDVLDTRVSGTGSWFLDSPELRSFQRGGSRVLWLHGSAGSGKSTVMAMALRQILVDTAVSNEGHLGLAHFFDATSSRHRDLRELLSMLLCRLAGSNDVCYKNLLELRGEHEDGYSQPSMETLRRQAHDLLGLVAKRVFIVVDALDEADDDTVVPFLQDLRDKHDNVSLLVSSRTEVPYREDLSRLADLEVAISQNLVAGDITLILGSKFAGTRLAKLGAKDADLVRKTLSTGSEGNFRWTILMAKELERVVGMPSEVRKMARTLPRRLKDIYDNAAASIPAHRLDDVRRLLGWLLFTHQSLPEHYSSELVAFDFSKEGLLPTFDRSLLPSSPDKIMAIINSTFLSYRGGYVRIAHNSVRDYLLDKTSRLHIDESSAHLAMTQMCLSYLIA
ncbi:hypothetical protein EV714DRAFT_214958, partial [Schizophyllum commune]